MHAALPLRLTFLQATLCATLGCKGQERTPCSQARTEWNASWQGELAVLAAVLAANQARAQAAEDAAANASLRNQQVDPLFHQPIIRLFLLFYWPKQLQATGARFATYWSPASFKGYVY